MKFIIVLACLLAVAVAHDDDVKVIHNEVDVNIDSFKYIIELDNHIKAIQHGILKDEHNWVVDGEYEFVSPKGVHVKVTYVADKDGYHAKTSQ